MNNCKAVLVSTDEATVLNFRIKKGSSLRHYFRFKDKDTGTFIDLTGIPVVMVLYNGFNETDRYEIGDGFTLDADPTYLVLTKLPQERNYPVGVYRVEMKITLTATNVVYALQGVYWSVESLI